MSIHIKKSNAGVYRQSIRVNQHTVFSDVASALGGNDSAPDPHDLYDASLAACKAITILMFTKRKQIPLDYLELELVRDATQENKGQYKLNVSITLYGPLSNDDVSKIAEIADKCPIHKLMTQAKTEVRTQTVLVS